MEHFLQETQMTEISPGLYFIFSPFWNMIGVLLWRTDEVGFLNFNGRLEESHCNIAQLFAELMCQ